MTFLSFSKTPRIPLRDEKVENMNESHKISLNGYKKKSRFLLTNKDE